MTILRGRVIGIAACALAVGSIAAPSAAEAQARRVDLKVLVLSAGDVGTASVKAALDEGMVPYTEVVLTEANRPVINDAFLSDVSPLLRRAKYQAVVLPNEAPAGLSSAERDALRRFQREFKIRQLDAYVYPSPAVGLSWPAGTAYIGPLDGLTGQVTPAAKSAGFDYLVGPVPFDDLNAEVPESYGYVSTPIPANPFTRQWFTPFVQMPIPDTSALGAVLGVYHDDGREEMVLTTAFNENQLQHQALMPGVIEWLTHGVHLGTARHFLSVHVDDVFMTDARWSIEANCTVGADCPPGVSAPEILMTPADVDYLLAWQARQGIKLDMAYNGAGYDQAIVRPGGFPLGQKLLQERGSLRWINHTYTHRYLGCVQDFSVTPWRCRTNLFGQIEWVPFATVFAELNENIAFAARHGIAIDRGELVTGEHSGLRRAPQEPSDNPNLVQALNLLWVTWAGSDNSRDNTQRSLGVTRTVPRHPMNIFYNVATRAEEIDEYNWIYTSRANGGSGLCENNPSSTCIAPLNPATDFEARIVPMEARIALMHVVANDPRPHYAHQSNLAEDRILYPVLDRLLERYRQIFAANAPVVNPTLAEAGMEFAHRGAWRTNRARVSAYVQGGNLVVSSAGLLNAYQVPITVPGATTGGTSLTPYAGSRTGWQSVIAPFSLVIPLPGSVGYRR